MSNVGDALGSDPGGEPITGVLRLTTGVTGDDRVRLELTTHASDRYGMSLWPDEARAYAAMLDVSANEVDRAQGRRDFATSTINPRRTADRAYAEGMARRSR
jgi:hypothetical protein